MTTLHIYAYASYVGDKDDANGKNQTSNIDPQEKTTNKFEPNNLKDGRV